MSEQITETLSKLEGWTEAFKGNGVISDHENRVTVKEAFMTPDAPILFPKVMSNVLREAAEPVYNISPLFDPIRTTSKLVEFPAVNSIKASHIAEGQEYPEQQLDFTKQAEGKVTKKGVKVSFTEEVIKDSQWDIIGLHVRAAGRAMARLKEQIAVDRFKEASELAGPKFDNSSSVQTTGRDINGALNGTLHWDDLMDMAADMHNNFHGPTDLIMNDLAWPMFAKAHGAMMIPGKVSLGNLGTREAASQAVSPLGINVILSPFVRLDSTSSPAVTDIYLIDRNEIGANLIRDELSTEEFDDPTRDLRSLKLRERYDLVCYGEGEGIQMAKSVAVAPSYEIGVQRSITTTI
jgi:hypothetical protein